MLLAFVVLRPEGGVALFLGLHAFPLLAVTASAGAAVLAPSRLVAGVAGYVALISSTAVVGALVAGLEPFHAAAGVGDAFDYAPAALAAAAALGFAMVGRAAGRRRGAHYR